MVDTALSNIERQERMLRFVEQRRRVTVADICDQFGVSVATARRDLELLAERGSVRRVHGGALAIHRAPPELPALERAGEQANEKRRIGQAAAQANAEPEHRIPLLPHRGRLAVMHAGRHLRLIAEHLRHDI